MDEKTNLQNNFRIMYEQLEFYIEKYYIDEKNEYLEYIEAYLAATIHTLMDYAERYLCEDSVIIACKYVNNIVKHVTGFVTFKIPMGIVYYPKIYPYTYYITRMNYL